MGETPIYKMSSPSFDENAPTDSHNCTKDPSRKKVEFLLHTSYLLKDICLLRLVKKKKIVIEV